MGVIFVSFAIMKVGYHDRGSPKPPARLTANRSSAQAPNRPIAERACLPADTPRFVSTFRPLVGAERALRHVVARRVDVQTRMLAAFWLAAFGSRRLPGGWTTVGWRLDGCWLASG